MHDVLESWNEYYSNPSIPLSFLYKSEYRSNRTASAGSQRIYRCFFAECTAAQGGSIIAKSETKLLIEETTFFSCQATSWRGGGLYFDTEGSCILSRVCSYKCKANSPGQFCYAIFPDSSLAYTNTMKDCSISGTNNPSYRSEIVIKYGTILASSINSSYNSCKIYSGIVAVSCSSTPSDCLVSYSCFTHNSMKEYSSVRFSENKNEMRSCNVINNTQGSSSFGAVFAVYYLDIYNSCIINNNAPYSIYQESSGAVNIYNTILDKSNYGSVITQSVAKTSFVNDLFFIKTGECDHNYYLSTKGRNNNNFKIFKLSCLIIIVISY